MFGLIPWRREEKAREFPMVRLPEEFEEMFERLFRPWRPAMLEPEYFWNVEVEEKEKELVVRAEVPGFETKDFEVEVRGDRLLIKAEHKFEEKKEEKEYEKRIRHYERAFTLPEAVDPEKVAAKYLNGVLEVTLPRKEDTKGRKVPVS